MTLPLAFLGSRTFGECSRHLIKKKTGGTIITGSPDNFCNGLNIARMGDIIKADCGHTSTIVTASSKRFCNGLGVARVGDIGQGDYTCTIITGSQDSFTE